MRAGKLKWRVQIQTFTESTGSGGGVTGTWSTTATVWADKTPQKVMERHVTQQRFAQATLGFRVRKTSFTITPKMRVRLSNNDSPETYRVFDILGTQEIEYDEGWDIFVKEDVS